MDLSALFSVALHLLLLFVPFYAATKLPAIRDWIDRFVPNPEPVPREVSLVDALKRKRGRPLFPDTNAPRIVRLLFWADITALSILGWMCLSAVSSFNPEKVYWGTRYAHAIATRCFFATLLILFSTLLLLTLSEPARRVRSFIVIVFVSIVLLILWLPVLT